MTWFGFYARPYYKPLAQLFYSLLANRNQAFLPTLSMNSDVAFLQKQLTHLQVAQLADAQSAAIQHFYDGDIPHALSFAFVDNLLYVVYLLNAQHLGQVFSYLRILQQLRRIGFYFLLQYEEPVERTNATQYAGHTTWLNTQFLKGTRELIQLFQRDTTEVNTQISIIVQQLLQIPDIGIQRIARIGPLQSEILHITPQNLRGYSACICELITQNFVVYIKFIQ